MALKDGISSITRAPASLGGQVRNSLSMANHRLARSAREWATVPAQIPAQVLDRIVEAVRERLDIPSRAEISSLIERLEAVDGKIAQLEADKAALAAQVADANKPKAKSRARTVKNAASDVETKNAETKTAETKTAETKTAETKNADAATADKAAPRSKAKASGKSRGAAKGASSGKAATSTKSKRTKSTTAAKTASAPKNGARAKNGSSPKNGARKPARKKTDG